MIKWKPQPPIEIKEEWQEILFYNDWILHSHYWVELDNCLQCKWCKDMIAKNFSITSEKITGILCPGNPYIEDNKNRCKLN